MRLLLIAVGLTGAAGLAQGVSPCEQSCGDTMAGCINRCGPDRTCSGGCITHLTDCNQKCMDNGKIKAAQLKQRMCPGATGRLVPCAEMETPQRAAPRKKHRSAIYPNQAAKDLMKDPRNKL